MLLTLYSEDGRNRLTRSKVEHLNAEIRNLCTPELPVLPLIISGEANFSVGADLNEIARLTGPEALEFAKAGQLLMDAVASYPATVVAAIDGYCMGGGSIWHWPATCASRRSMPSSDIAARHLG